MNDAIEQFEKDKPNNCDVVIRYKGNIKVAYYLANKFFFDRSMKECYLTECITWVMKADAIPLRIATMEGHISAIRKSYKAIERDINEGDKVLCHVASIALSCACAYPEFKEKHDTHNWVIMVAGGHGAFLLQGTEAEAEDMRCHKAKDNRAVALKRLADDEEIREQKASQCFNHPNFYHAKTMIIYDCNCGVCDV